MIIRSLIRDPYFNLTLENYYLGLLGEDTIKSERILLMYENDPCVVMGRFQNPWIECNLEKMHEDKIKLVRRQSGGGTVYHDNNNMNFSFIAKKHNHKIEFNQNVVVCALKSLNVEAFATKRGDIRLKEKEERKISGSAYKEKRTSAFHHGTMLIESDLDLLNNYISSDKLELKTKSIASIRSVVANIKDINPDITKDIFCEALKDEFLKSYNQSEYLTIDQNSDIFSNLKASDYYLSLKDFNWLYEQTPYFEIDKTLEFGHVNLVVKKGIIQSAYLDFNDCHPSFSNDISRYLESLSVFEVSSKLRKESVFREYENITNEFISWIEEYFCLNKLPGF